MTENLISASLTKEDIEAIMSAISTIKTKLPFLVDLTPEEAKSLSRMGDKSRAFVTKSLDPKPKNSPRLFCP
jgi:hypothetical protein